MSTFLSSIPHLSLYPAYPNLAVFVSCSITKSSWPPMWCEHPWCREWWRRNDHMTLEVYWEVLTPYLPPDLHINCQLRWWSCWKIFDASTLLSLPSCIADIVISSGSTCRINFLVYVSNHDHRHVFITLSIMLYMTEHIQQALQKRQLYGLRMKERMMMLEHLNFFNRIIHKLLAVYVRVVHGSGLNPNPIGRVFIFFKTRPTQTQQNWDPNPLFFSIYWLDCTLV